MNTRSPLALMVALALVAVGPATAQSPKPLEFEVKATYLLNFGRFATWRVNAPASEPFAICVIGRDPFGSTLDQTVAGEMIDGRSVIARRIANAEDTKSCRILFVSGSEEARLPTILPIAQSAGVLTVSDLPRFSDRGGMIQFVPQDKRVRFQVNATAVEQAGLNLSSELLRVAAAVMGGSRDAGARSPHQDVNHRVEADLREYAGQRGGPRAGLSRVWPLRSRDFPRRGAPKPVHPGADCRRQQRHRADL